LETVESELLTALKVLADIDFEILESYKDAFDEISTRNKLCADSLKTYIEKAMAKKMAMESAGQTLSELLSIKLPTCPISDIVSVLTLMEQETTKLQSLAIPQQLSALQSQMSELSARKKLVEIKPNVIQYLSDLKRAALYDLCIKETDTTQITKKGNAIISAAFTEQFKNLLNRELRNFGSQIQLTLESHGIVGETVHKLILSDCQLPKGTKVTDILSEGEQRIVSVASFLAELEACGHNNPIVFDDPISSLDHIWREKVADRLTREAAKRQVIVFTHDIVFTTAAMYFAKIANIPITLRSIQRCGDMPGLTADELPWKATGVKQKIDELEKKNARLRKERQLMTTEVYDREVSSFYSDMRNTIEKAVEEVVFSNIVKRYDSHIPINRDIIKVTVLDVSDCKTLLVVYKKCCDITDAHSNISAANIAVPEPDEIAQDHNILKNWINNIRDKQKALS
jgi:ABC-type lipoprotein export system ATPase subunit